MKTNIGKVVLLQHVPGKIFVLVEDHEGFRTSARLTPEQALRLSGQLARWAWKQFAKKGKGKKP